MNTNRLVLAAALSLLPVSPLFGDSIRLANTAGQAYYVWFRTEANAWRPPILVAQHGRVVLNLATPGKFFLVIRDLSNRDTRIGNVDVHRIARYPGTQLVINQRLVERQYTVYVPVQRQVQQTRVDEWGRRYTVNVTVTEYVSQTRTRTVAAPNLRVKVDDKLMDIAEFMKLLDKKSTTRKDTKR